VGQFNNGFRQDGPPPLAEDEFAVKIKFGTVS